MSIILCMNSASHGNFNLYESTEKTRASVKMDEEKQIVENIDGKTLKEHAAVDLPDEKRSARGAQNEEVETFQAQTPASETDQIQKASQTREEFQLSDNQVALIPQTPKDPRYSTPLDARLGASDLNQIASAASGKDQQDDNESSATDPINTSAKGQGKLTDPTQVNAVKAGNTSLKTVFAGISAAGSDFARDFRHDICQPSIGERDQQRRRHWRLLRCLAWPKPNLPKEVRRREACQDHCLLFVYHKVVGMPNLEPI